MITLQNVTKEYQKGSIGLDNVSLEVDKGELIQIAYALLYHKAKKRKAYCFSFQTLSSPL